MRKNKKLKIGIFCSVEFPTPPSLEMKDIHAPLWLTNSIVEELVKRKHQVTLFASSDSKTKAKLISDGLISLPKNKKLSRFYKQVSELGKERFFEGIAERRETINFYEFLLASKLTQMALKEKFDIVYVQGKRILPFATIYTTSSEAGYIIFGVSGQEDIPALIQVHRMDVEPFTKTRDIHQSFAAGTDTLVIDGTLELGLDGTMDIIPMGLDQVDADGELVYNNGTVTHTFTLTSSICSSRLSLLVANSIKSTTAGFKSESAILSPPI